MNQEDIDPRVILDEARALWNAACRATDEFRYDQLILWTREVLRPLVEAKNPEALWLQCCLPREWGEHISDEENDRRYLLQVREAADAGNPEAKFYLACEMDEEPTITESARLFKEAAEQGYSYAKWCHGLNLLSGRGVEKNEALGLRYIQESADEKFEGAIKFLADAYAYGGYGFPKDQSIAASWWSKLKHRDVIRY